MKIIESSHDFDDTESVQMLDAYRKQALKLAKVSFLSDAEGFAARIPGFRGLLSTGQTKKQALAEVESALADWIDLALKRGLGLPAVNQSAREFIAAH